MKLDKRKGHRAAPYGEKLGQRMEPTFPLLPDQTTSPFGICQQNQNLIASQERRVMGDKNCIAGMEIWQKKYSVFLTFPNHS